MRTCDWDVPIGGHKNGRTFDWVLLTGGHKMGTCDLLPAGMYQGWVQNWELVIGMYPQVGTKMGTYELLYGCTIVGSFRCGTPL